MLAWEGFWCIGGAGYTLVYTGDKEHSNKDFTKYSSKIYCSSQRKSWFRGEEDIWYSPEIILHYTWLIVLSHNSIIQELCSVTLASKNLGLFLGQSWFTPWPIILVTIIILFRFYCCSSITAVNQLPNFTPPKKKLWNNQKQVNVTFLGTVLGLLLGQLVLSQ